MSDYLPTVILPGIGQSFVEMVDENGKKIKNAWPLSISKDLVMEKIKKPLAKMMLLRRDAGFSEAVAQIAAETVDPLAINPDGRTKHRLRPRRFDVPASEYPEEDRKRLYRMVPMQGLAEIIGEDKLFFFAYNSFGDLPSLVDELNAFIKNAKARTGADKVNLLPVSLGGVLMNAYFDKYLGEGDVHRVVNIVAASGGTSVVADVLAHEVEPAEAAQIASIISRGAVEKAKTLMKTVPSAVVEKTMHAAIDAAVQKVCVNSTVTWGAVPGSRYAALERRYLSDGRHEHVRACAARMAEIHNNYPAFVKKITDSGVQIFNLCGYGLQLLPLIKTKTVTSDGMIDTALSSMGAYCAPLGKKFAPGYKPKNDGVTGAVSPDGRIDASACALPDTTWLFSDQEHEAIADNKKAISLAVKLLTDDGFASVHDDPEYPRFS